MSELDDDAYELGDPKRSDFTELPIEIGPNPHKVTYPIMRFPTSVTHWTCPDAPTTGFTHHMISPQNVCEYCHRGATELRQEQEGILQRRRRHRGR